jgi:ferrochelatase
VPLSFVSDHIETLYEVDMLFADAARDAGITGYYRPDALNTSPLFIDALAGLVRNRLASSQTVTSALPDLMPALAVAGPA